VFGELSCTLDLKPHQDTTRVRTFCATVLRQVTLQNIPSRHCDQLDSWCVYPLETSRTGLSPRIGGRWQPSVSFDVKLSRRSDAYVHAWHPRTCTRHQRMRWLRSQAWVRPSCSAANDAFACPELRHARLRGCACPQHL